MLIDCDDCAARGPACEDCMITALLAEDGATPAVSGGCRDIEPAHVRALHVLAEHGLVAALRHRPDGGVDRRRTG